MSPSAQAIRTVNFTAFAQRIETRLVSYLRYLLGRTVEAEDVFQETLIRAHTEWRSVAKMDKPEAWVFRVARNLAMNQLKRRGIEKRVLHEKSFDTQSHHESAGEKTELETRVAEALQTLPMDQREAVCLKVWGEHSWVEIGRVLEVSEDTAARLFARGLKAIAPQLKELSP